MAINIFKKKQAENSNGLICKQKKHWEILRASAIAYANAIDLTGSYQNVKK